MDKQLLIYDQVEALSKQKHADLYVKSGNDYSFAKDINSIPLMAVEFRNAANEYPIVFTGGNEIMPAVIVGTRNDENLYYSVDKGWDANYVPAFIRRYPFVFSSSDAGEHFTLCVDSSFSGCNTEGKGERLFDSEGEQTQYLKNVLAFMKEYQAHFKRSQMFCQKLKELDLLEEVGAQFQENGKQRSLTGFLAVNREKLKALSAEQLKELMQNDSIELLYLHLHSLNNLNALVQRSIKVEAA
ncbi:SapC family protein [Paraferrimonas sp. SM1919]|uniref:SapC family protein n=1 Tax=Paraferrimonas sp. SM1919 TaxID=2662263 RepID=UPI0013D0107B|nr:SapC family protein [Paraferrimonas sp. SM1919]